MLIKCTATINGAVVVGEINVQVTLTGVEGGTLHDNENITTDVTWTKTSGPHIVRGTVTVGASSGDAILHIQAGTEVRFEAGAKLAIGESDLGGLIANGTSTERITFTSAKAGKSPGDWVGILFGRYTRSDSILNYCYVEYAGGENDDFFEEGNIMIIGDDIAGPALRITNTTVRYSALHGIVAKEKGRFAGTSTGLTINNCPEQLIVIDAGSAATIPSGSTYSAAGGKGFLVQTGEVNASGTWRNHGPHYYLEDNISIGNNAQLTIEPGVTLRLPGEAFFYVGSSSTGKLVAVGAPGNPVCIKSYTGVIPRFGGLVFGNNNSGSRLEYATIEYGGGVTYDGVHGGSIILDCPDPGAFIKNTSLRNSGDCAIYAPNAGAGHTSFLTGLGNQFEGNAVDQCLGGNCGNH